MNRSATHRLPTPGLLRTAATIGAGALLLAGCGESAAESDAETDAGAEAGITVAAADTDLGSILVDGDGMTLYMFDPDEGAESTCYDDCAESWPPLVGDAAEAGDGADNAMLGTTARDDGDQQITYNNWPLYYWAGDDDAGEVNGQAVNDIWWVLDTDGEPVSDDAEDENDARSSGY